MLGSCVQLMVVTGILGAYIAGIALPWRWLAVLCSFPSCIMLLFMSFMPETPRFLLSRSRRSEAVAALRFLRGPLADHEGECEQIEAGVQEEGLNVSEFKNPSIYRPLLIGVALMFFQQLTGINAVMFYAETIFEDANFKDSRLASVVVGSIQVCFTAVAALIIDKTGRKVLLYISGGTPGNHIRLFVFLPRMFQLVLSRAYPKSRTFSLSCSASEEGHKKLGGSRDRTSYLNQPKGCPAPQHVPSVETGGKKELIAAQGLAEHRSAGGVIMALSTALFGLYFKMVLPNPTNSSNPDVWAALNSASPGAESSISWLAVVSLGCFVAGFALGWGPIPWLVTSEIFPLKARGVSSGACVLTNWAMAFLVTKEFNDLIGFLTSYGTFWLFSALCCLNIAFTAFYVPETKGQTLEQIEAYFRRS
ncbi:solute carrier family 2, facilitated glucose transporter member 8 isoform X2 [Pezoporus wallicus]|nr:solute carrier family 2, facilitated glucose transporter member 8 isoform X2 [Pezoporus wallicus]